jgi:hypothetical protein
MAGSRPVMTEFLLKLATDRAAYVKAAENPTDVMADAGLSPEQREAIKSGNARRITEAVMSELNKCSWTDDPYCGNTITIVMGHDHVQFLMQIDDDDDKKG